jgi:hypothetical protein
MHTPVELHQHRRTIPQKGRQHPLQKPMAPIRRARERHVLRSTTASNLAQRSLHKLTWVRDQHRRLADLGHGRSDKVRLYALHADAVRFEFGAEGGRPLLEEGLAARVGREERSREEAAERRHGKHKAPLARHHTRRNLLGNPQRRHAINHDDIPHLRLWRLHKRHRNAVAESDVVDQDADVQSVDEFPQCGVVAVLVLAEIHRERLGRDLGAMLGGDGRGEVGELGLRARDEDEVVAFGGKSEGEFFADAVAGAGDEGPGAAGAEGGELELRKLCIGKCIEEGYVQICRAVRRD